MIYILLTIFTYLIALHTWPCATSIVSSLCPCPTLHLVLPCSRSHEISIIGIARSRNLKSIRTFLYMLDGIIASDDTLYRATNKETYLEHTIRRYCYLIARSHLLALCCRRCTIGGINELSRSILRNSNKLYFERIIAYARSFVNESCFQALVKEVSIMIATQHLLPISTRVFHLIQATNSCIESLVNINSIVCRCCDLNLIVAHIGDASSLTSRNHSTNLIFIFQPMGKENTWCARHSKKISVGSKCIATNRILLFA